MKNCFKMENSDLEIISANEIKEGTYEEENKIIKLEKREICGQSEIKNSEEQCKHDSIVIEILEEIKDCPVIFQSQQRGDPELTVSDKKQIAYKLLHNKPETFLLRFGEFLKEEHLNYFLNKFSTSYEVQYYVKNLKHLLNDRNKKLVKRNRRYEAMRRMEAEGSYFSETEMEKREPLLYYQMVGQYLSENERLLKHSQTQENFIPSFSNFLIQQMERDELDKLIKTQQDKEDMEEEGSSSEDETSKNSKQNKLWGEDWEDKQSRKKIKMKQSKKDKVLSKKEKNFLLQEFKSIMKNNFLNGRDTDFNYSEVDFNSDFDSVDLRAQDEEEKYFEEETNDGTVCTDTGIEDY